MTGLIIFVCGVGGGLLLGAYVSRLSAICKGLSWHDDRCGRAECDGQVADTAVCVIDGVQHVCVMCRHTAERISLEAEDDPPPSLRLRINGSLW